MTQVIGEQIVIDNKVVLWSRRPARPLAAAKPGDGHNAVRRRRHQRDH